MSYVQEMVAYEGKVFQVNLQSMLGSSPYGWALSNLPEGIVLEAVETSQLAAGNTIGPVVQSFYLGVTAVKEYNVKLTFLLLCSFEPKKIVDSCTVNLRIVPENANQFATYSDNAAASTGSAMNNTDPIQTKYGFPCVMQDSALMYGFNCAQPQAVTGRGAGDDQNTHVAYGMPCTKYGLACQPAVAAVDYGLVDSSAGNEVNSAMPYGYISSAAHKYGYPCVMQSDSLYGMSFNCVNNNQNQEGSTPFIRKTTPFINPGSPFVDNAQMKYGYPTCQ